MIDKTAAVDKTAQVGDGTNVWAYTQIRENASLGKNCVVGRSVYIDHDVQIGDNCKIQNNASLYFHTVLENGVFIGPHVCLTNDATPRAVNADGSLKSADDWQPGKIVIKEGASIGASAVVLTNVTIGKFAMIGAGSVVTKDVPDFGLVYGNPAKLVGYVDETGKKVRDA